MGRVFLLKPNGSQRKGRGMFCSPMVMLVLTAANFHV
jgi:hypothetical protein